jgi:hypothetical protein
MPKASAEYSPKNRAQLRRLARRSVSPDHAALPPLPAGPYDVVYADPLEGARGRGFTSYRRFWQALGRLSQGPSD